MSIFSKKSRPKEPDGKSKEQQNVTNGTKSAGNRQNPKHRATPSIANGVLTDGDRLAQRAQIMAASRRRMNSDTPDYSIVGASKSHSTSYSNSASLSSRNTRGDEQSGRGVKNNEKADSISNGMNASSQKIPKMSKQNEIAERNMNNTANDFTPKSSITSTKVANPPAKTFSPMQKPRDPSISDVSSNAYSSVQRTFPMPLDSPTLGYPKAQEEGFVRPLQSSDSGYGSAAQLAVTTSRKLGEAYALQQSKSNRVPLADNGTIPGLKGNRKLARQTSSPNGTLIEGESLAVSSATDPREKSDSRSSTFISRLDPGPSGSIFADAVDSAGISREGKFGQAFEPTRKNPPWDDYYSQTTKSEERGRSITQTPKQSPRLRKPIENRPMNLSQVPSESRIRPVPGAFPPSPTKNNEAPQPPSTQPSRASTPPPLRPTVVTSGRDATSRINYLFASKAESPAYAREPPVVGQSTSKPVDVEPQSGVSPLSSMLQPKVEGTERQHPAPAAPSAEPTIAPSLLDKETSTRKAVSQAPMHQTQSEPRASLTSERRLTLPPLSVLDGLKVNRRGQVLDEEGDVIGELFEGDIIDCVRQKINADGDVLDEFGNPVGRVRPVRRGHASPGRFSVSSAFAINHPSGPFPWARGDSSASQKTQTQSVHSPRVTVAPVLSPPFAGNVFVAELDASAEAEAAPVLDHSEIFSPCESVRIRDRSWSPATSQKAKQAVEERAIIQPTVPETKNESSNDEEGPKKWSSRYLEPGTSDAQPTPRRSLEKPETTRSSMTETPPIFKQANVPLASESQSRSRAVIGPTLESLLGKNTIFSHKAETFSLRSSSPDMTLSSSKSGTGAAASIPTSAASPSHDGPKLARPSSIHYGTVGPGLGSQLSVRSSYSQHQPIRKSPLAMHETTPPSSGNDPDAGKLRNMSFLATVPRSNSTRPANVPEEIDDAALIPDIPKARPQQRKKTSTVPLNSENTLDKRKSRLSFMFGK